ncbi:carbohydrate-binding protein [Tamlana sp. 2_MG-2023]|uniref:carbohydrate-binding protein n=1 Tax=unclassified Tamlana TaxID=2614803 RepID=UPI0026E1BAF9|nr:MULTISPECIES: carbohydrate-binding protein [unclassified Tamlana]MDO6761474.1 carbohydrate-binding protein [Tamlana sp. 2_MG-2023]MDO6792351.1 carbohydrate-binding protein [Tamlana sp. 1_MG-2023]
MKPKTYASLLLALVVHVCFSAEIHVSKTGNDSNSGTEASPYRTIEKAANVAVAGDVVIIHEGTYEETLTPKNSGTAGNPITFRGAPGEAVIITAMQAVNNWTLDNGNVYKATVNWDLGQDNMCLHNNQLMDLARWPNNTPQNLFERDYLPACNTGTAGGSRSVLNYGNNRNGHEASIPYAGKWENGGTIHFYGGAGFLAWTDYITGSSANQINFYLNKNLNWINEKHHPGYTGHGVKRGEFFLQGIKEALDYKNEWFYSNNTLYVQIDGGGAPTDNTIQFRKRQQTINLNKNYIHVENLAVFGGEITLSGDNNRVYQVSSFYGNHTLNVINSFDSGRQSVLMTGRNNTVERCEIAWGGGNGVYDKGDNNKLLNSYVHDFNYLGNYDCVLNTRGATGGSYRNNTLTRAGKDVIQAYVDGGEFAYNDISYSMRIADDGGLLYTTNSRASKSSIHHNIFHDSDAREGRFKAAGIYLDNRSKNWDVHHNVVYNTEWTNVQINWDGTNLNIFNNTFVNGSATMGAWYNGYNQSNVKVWNNITEKEASDRPGNQEDEHTWEPTADKQNNLVSATSFNNITNNDFTLKANAQAIDYGRVIDLNGINYTDGYQGANPDVGAYEYGNTPWVAGISWSGSASGTCYGLPGETCSNSATDSVSFTQTVDAMEPELSFEVPVRYSATETRDVYAVFTAPDGTWLGNGMETVPAGSGSVAISIDLPSLPELGEDYKISIAIRPTGSSNWVDNLDEAVIFTDILEAVITDDYVEFVNLPSEFVQTTSIEVEVAYKAVAPRDVSVVLTQPNGAWLANGKVTVEAGTGTVAITIPLNALPALGEDYKLDATIRTVGGGYADNTHNQYQLVDIVEALLEDAPQGLTIEAELFLETGGTYVDDLGTGVNKGEFGINYVNNEDWAKYTFNVTEGGTYELTYLISSPSDNAEITILIDGVAVSVDAVENNGAWDTYQELIAQNEINLTTGQHTLEIRATGSNNWQWNLDKIKLTQQYVLDAEDHELKVVWYPNPAQDFVSMVSKKQITLVRIFDTKGVLVKQIDVRNTAATLLIDDLQAGVYILEVELVSGRQQQKIIKL